jgi:hypothetical protein
VWLGGVPATVRIDNLKTGVAQGAGTWAVLHAGYASYAQQLGFIIDPCHGSHLIKARWSAGVTM